MSQYLYKYAGPAHLDKIFAAHDKVTLKCSRPDQFNDPYELFLTIDYNQDPDVLAYYADAVGSIPQVPTTCFSRSPAVVPMWAHYANNLEGFVIEFDEEKIKAAMPNSSFGDVEYKDVPDDGLQLLLLTASTLGKPRHHYRLLGSVHRAAYFTKATCWNYEKERRMIVQSESEYRVAEDMFLIDIPVDCVRSIISGPRASKETSDALRAKSDELGCNFFQLKIGKSTTAPFFVDTIESSFIFDGQGIKPSIQSCSSCSEPLPAKQKTCSWCQLDESHMMAAAGRNPFRIFSHYGILDDYLNGMDNITKNATKSRD
jgi:hypothetical protein